MGIQVFIYIYLYRDYRGYIGVIRYILGLHKDNAKEHRNYYF